MSEAVDPVEAEVHAQEGEPPGPGRVPRQLHQAVPVPHVHVSSQLTASHEHPEGVQSVHRLVQHAVHVTVALFS